MASVLLQKTPYGSFGSQPGGTLAKYQGKDLSSSVMDKEEELPMTAEELARSLAEKDALQPPMLGPISIDPTDWLTPGGLAKVAAILKGVLAPAAATSAAMLVGSRVAGPTSQLARTLPRQAGALLPEPYYHGTTQAFDEMKDGLKFLTPSSDTAHSYAYGGGGNRKVSSKSLIHDFEQDKTYEILKESKDGYPLIREAGKKDAPKLEYRDQDKFFTEPDAPDIPGFYTTDLKTGKSVENPDYEDWYKNYTRVDQESSSVIPTGANIRRTAVDINKPLNLRKPNNEAVDPGSFSTLASLDPQGNRFAAAIINDAKKGEFHWSNTKYEPHQKAWETILIPQLQERGYDALKFWDDGHDTLAVFSNKSLKSVESLRLPTTSTAAQDEALKNLSEAYGIDVSSMIRKSK